jgi:Lrp/AsnC ligand binding domain
MSSLPFQSPRILALMMLRERDGEPHLENALSARSEKEKPIQEQSWDGGAISGFTVRLKPDAEPQRVRAITMLAVDGEHAAAVLKSLRGIPEVQALHTTNGRWDIVVELGVESLEAFDQALQRIRLIKRISSSETSLLLSTHKI